MPAFPVSTVHKFQGRENDVIILSTVSNEIQEFIEDPHLLNVAVSRAKKKFILAVTGNEFKDSNKRDLVSISHTITAKSRKVRYALSSTSCTDNMLKKERSSYRPEFPYLNTSQKI